MVGRGWVVHHSKSRWNGLYGKTAIQNRPRKIISKWNKDSKREESIRRIIKNRNKKALYSAPKGWKTKRSAKKLFRCQRYTLKKGNIRKGSRVNKKRWADSRRDWNGKRKRRVKFNYGGTEIARNKNFAAGTLRCFEEVSVN